MKRKQNIISHIFSLYFNWKPAQSHLNPNTISKYLFQPGPTQVTKNLDDKKKNPSGLFYLREREGILSVSAADRVTDSW